MSRLRSLLLLPLLLPLATSAFGQTQAQPTEIDVPGRVLDSATGEGIATAFVAVTDLRLQVVTDTAGYFHLVIPAGKHHFRFSRVGYDAIEGDIDVDERTGIRVGLQPRPLVLDGVTVTADGSLTANRRLQWKGFYERRERYGKEGLGAGKFLTEEDIERRVPFFVSDVFRDVLGVRVHSSGNGRDSYLTMRGNCIPSIYLDGMRVSRIPLNELVSAYELAGVEIYTGIIVPPEFTGDLYGKPCGSIALWTK